MIGIKNFAVMAACAAAVMGISSCSSAKKAPGSTAPTEPAASYPAPIDTDIVCLTSCRTDGTPTEQALFEEVNNGSVTYIFTDEKMLSTKLAEMEAAGEAVDVVEIEGTDIPQDMSLFQPADSYFEYMDFDSELWTDVRSVSESLAVDGKHYIIPGEITSVMLVTYSKKLMEEEKIGDPYKLWQEGKWDMAAMNEMMTKFKENAPDAPRYGASGSGCAGVIRDSDPVWRDSWSGDRSSLFFVDEDWTVGISNANNPDEDIMIVPMPETDGSRNYGVHAYLMAKGSQKCEAAAAYIKCGRLAATDEKFVKAARENALKEEKTSDGTVVSKLTGELYDLIQEYKKNVC